MYNEIQISKIWEYITAKINLDDSFNQTFSIDNYEINIEMNIDFPTGLSRAGEYTIFKTNILSSQDSFSITPASQTQKLVKLIKGKNHEDDFEFINKKYIIKSADKYLINDILSDHLVINYLHNTDQVSIIISNDKFLEFRVEKVIYQQDEFLNTLNTFINLFKILSSEKTLKQV